jgi:hypothetical protein
MIFKQVKDILHVIKEFHEQLNQYFRKLPMKQIKKKLNYYLNMLIKIRNYLLIPLKNLRVMEKTHF